MDMYNRSMAPDIKDGKQFTYRALFRGNDVLEFPTGVIVDGEQSRDPGNTGDEDVLRAGIILGKLSSGKYAPFLAALTQGAYVSGGLTITVLPAYASEIQRRLGGVAGTLVVVGPPTPGGVVAEIETTLSGIDTGTGDLTITDLGANMIDGAFVNIKDGTEKPLGFQFKPSGLKVTDPDCEDINAQTSLAIGGTIDSSQIINWPSDTSLQDWLADELNSVGQYVFDHPYL
jgi:hypothetical protein